MKWLCLGLFILYPVFSRCEVLDFKEKGHLILTPSKDWELKQNVMGFPFILFSPHIMGQRSNLSFLASGDNFEFEVASMKKNQDQFKKLKENWAEKIGATVDQLIPYQSQLNSKGHRVNSIGVKYTHNNKHYIEKSYYIECRGKMYFSKILSSDANFQHTKLADEMIKGIDCE